MTALRTSKRDSTKVLVLGGAGAVGVVYGAHLTRGGAEVAVYVRPTRVEEARRGFDLHRVSFWGRRATERWTPASALSTVTGRFDQVWLATASDALFEPWLPRVLSLCPRTPLPASTDVSELEAAPGCATPPPGPRCSGPSSR